MNRLKALWAEAQRYFSRLSQREQLLIGAAGLCFVIIVFFFVISTFMHSINHQEESIEEKLGSLQKVAVYSQSYAANERARKEMELKLSGPPVRLMSQLQQLAEKHSLTISAMNDRGEQTKNKVKESLVELQIASASIADLTGLLNDIESSPQLMKVRKMRLRPITAENTSLNVSLTVGTYQLVSKG